MGAVVARLYDLSVAAAESDGLEEGALDLSGSSSVRASHGRCCH